MASRKRRLETRCERVSYEFRRMGVFRMRGNELGRTIDDDASTRAAGFGT